MLKAVSSSDELAALRTVLASERTLMAWIRTSLAMISFGFTIGKVGDALSSADARRFSRMTDINSVAYFLVIVGTLALILAAIQYRLELRLVPHPVSGFTKVPFVVAILLSFLGLLAFADLLTRF